jgi:hypothetical protein
LLFQQQQKDSKWETGDYKMKHSLFDILIRPGAFFQDAIAEKESLKIPGLIVLAVAIVGAAIAYFVSNPTAQMMDGISSGLGALTIVGALMVGFIGALVFWILWTEVFFIASMILRKELNPGFNREFIGTTLVLSGIFLLILTSLLQQKATNTMDTISILLSLLSLLALVAIIVSVFIFLSREKFKRPLEFIGYGYLPQIFGAILTTIVAIQYLPRVVVPQISSGAIQEDPQLIQEAVKALMHDPAMMEMTQIISIISIVFLLWSANIWIFGMRYARELSERDSALCVGIPVVGYILYIIYTMTGI